MIIFTLDGALHVRDLINESFDQAIKGLERSIEEGNYERILYWRGILPHLMIELNWIEKIIIEKIKAITDYNSDCRITI